MILTPVSKWKRNGSDLGPVLFHNCSCCMDERSPLPGMVGIPWESLHSSPSYGTFSHPAGTHGELDPWASREPRPLACWLNWEPYAEPLMQFCEYSGICWLVVTSVDRHSGASDLFQVEFISGCPYTWEKLLAVCSSDITDRGPSSSNSSEIWVILIQK